jgi:hypothetical protein
VMQSNTGPEPLTSTYNAAPGTFTVLVSTSAAVRATMSLLPSGSEAY